VSVPIAFGLGSNLGDPLANLAAGATELASSFEGVELSSVYVTAPVGGPPQPDYLNAVLVAQAPDASEAVARRALALAHEVEASLHRTREVRWGPRTLDIDLLAVGGLQLDAEDIRVPHPRAAQRAFVLVPWAEVAPEAMIPGTGAVAAALAALAEPELQSVRLFDSPTVLGISALRSRRRAE